MRKILIDAAGLRFGRWLVIERAENYGTSAGWKCVCDCGTVKTVVGRTLRNGTSRSCGCLKDELRAAQLRTHGLSGTPEFNVWRTMLQRCTNPKNKDFKYYGGRGIKVCQEWRASFATFIADIGRKPFPRAEIDRRNNNGNYEPGNCRWVDDFQQAGNRRMPVKEKTT